MNPSTHFHPDQDMAPQRRHGMVVEVMANCPYTATPDLDVAEAADVMLRHDVRSLPVVEGSEVIGIIGRRDRAGHFRHPAEADRQIGDLFALFASGGRG